jgi:hypothetical protein
MASDNKCSLDNMLQAVLSVANQEQSMFYSPRIYSDHFNVVTSLLLSELVKNYPKNPMLIDLIDPFVEVMQIPATNGYIQLPDNFRDILGSPVVFANPDNSGECGSTEPLTAQNFKTGILKAGCKLNPIVITSQSEFAYLTRSTYNAPNYENPIGYFSGKRQIKVCPFDVTKAGVMFARNEKVVRYGYIQQPDDTFIFDLATSIESEWGSNAFEPIFKALCSLYSAYARDPDLSNWAQILKNGIL